MMGRMKLEMAWHTGFTRWSTFLALALILPAVMSIFHEATHKIKSATNLCKFVAVFIATDLIFLHIVLHVTEVFYILWIFSRPRSLVPGLVIQPLEPLIELGEAKAGGVPSKRGAY